MWSVLQASFNDHASNKITMGIRPEDWPMIAQVVMEIHDISGRLARIKAMLAEYAFRRIVIDQEGILRGSNVYNLYASR